MQAECTGLKELVSLPEQRRVIRDWCGLFADAHNRTWALDGGADVTFGAPVTGHSVVLALADWCSWAAFGQQVGVV